MGNLCVSQPVNPDQIKTNDKINQELKKDKARIESEVKLLLLGAGESGKSTVAKQMKIIHLEGFTKAERESYKSIIASNTVGSMRVLISACRDMGFQILPENKGPAARVCDPALFKGELNPSLGNDIKQLWADPAISNTFTRSSEFQLNDSAGFYFDHIDRISQVDYVPTEQDVLRSRTKTTGIIETEFEVEKIRFRMVDVGGQRSERKKWMYCFQDVTAVIFCVALSEYDLKLYEDDTTNRMQESLKLFKEICNTKWFCNTAMILFLNKRDLFAEKIQRVDLNVCFPEYQHGKNQEKAEEFIGEAFMNQREKENSNKEIYTHFTCATDTSNITVVFNAVKNIILNQMLVIAGM